MKSAFVVSSPMTVRAFLQDQIRALAATHDVTVVSNFQEPGELGTLPASVRIERVGIHRKIAVAADLQALFVLWRFFRQQEFDVVHSVTPKAGLLSMLAARFAGVPHRLHTYTGQVWATKHGLARALFRALDKVIFTMSSRCYVDSNSQRDFLISEGVVDVERSQVLAHGSISGVDLERFSASEVVRASMRVDLGISENAFVCLFLGRLSRDKGVLDLVQAFLRLDESGVESVLLIVGPDEDGMHAKIQQLIGDARSRIVFVDFTDVPERYMNAADLFCLPSYREGFGSVVIEAAAVGIPALGSNIYGISDAIENGVTGLLHEPRGIDDIHSKLTLLRDDHELRVRMGEAAMARARTMFAKELVTASLVAEYAQLEASLSAVS